MTRTILICLLAISSGWTCAPASAAEHPARRTDRVLVRATPLPALGPITSTDQIMVWPPKPPFLLVAPAKSELTAHYELPLKHFDVMSGYRDRRGRGRHNALDFEAIGPNCGLGTPIFAIGRSRVIRLGSSAGDSGNFGRLLRRRGTVRRGGRILPASMVVPVYGRVFFFTRNYGRWRSGTIIETELIEGPLAGFTVRYMHLGAIHPDLQVGDTIQRGQEIGLMGGTAILRDRPHVHFDVSDPRGNRVDPSPFLGLDEHGNLLSPAPRSSAVAKPTGAPK